MTQTTTLRTAGEALARAAAALYRRGWMEGTSGNLSIRLDDDLALITPSGRSKGELTPADHVLIAAVTGEVRAASGVRPSAETAIHAALYETVAGCGAVVHAHPPYATAVSTLAATAGQATVTFTDFEFIKGLGIEDPCRAAVPVFANWGRVSQIAEDVAEHYTRTAAAPPVLLIERHGATAWGPTLETARNRLECLEALCQLHLLINHSLTAGRDDHHDHSPDHVH